MRLPHSWLAHFLRWRLYLVPAVLLVAFWLPAANQGWYRTDTHFYAAIGKQAFDAAGDAANVGDAVRALVFLRAGDQPYFNKPPLPFWAHGAAIKLFGLDIWSVRLPSLGAAILGAWATAFAVARLGTRRLAMVVGLVLATTVEYFRYTRAISLDLWMTMFIMWSVAMCAQGVARDRAPWLAWSGVPLGLALLCKPMVALLAPAIIAAWLVWIGRRRLAAWTLASVPVAVAVAAPWHVAMALEYHDQFLQTYFVEQSLDRATVQSSGPAWYYLALLGETYWPWMATLVLGVIAAARGAWPAASRAGGVLRLSFLWVAVWLVALSAFGGKAPRYLAPVLPLLSVASAAWFTRPGSATVATRRIGRAVFQWGPAAAVIVGAVLALTGVKVHAPREARWDAILREVDARPGCRLYTTTRQHPIAANLVMLGREWPPVLKEAESGVQPSPRLLLMHSDDALPGPSWRVVGRWGGILLAADDVRP